MTNKKKQIKIENTKHLVIQNVMDNFANFKVFLKQMTNNKKVIQTFPKLNNIINLNKEELKNELNKSSNSDYEKIMTTVHKHKIMKGGRIVAPANIEEMCKNNIHPNGNYQDPISYDDLGVDDGGEIRRILKDDNGGEYPNAYCYNESTICDGAQIKPLMNRDPMSFRSWSDAFRQDLDCEFVAPPQAVGQNIQRQGGDNVGLLYPARWIERNPELAETLTILPVTALLMAVFFFIPGWGQDILGYIGGGRRKRCKTHKHKKKRRKSTRKHKKRHKKRRRTRKR